ncbi:MAG TPA: iron-containing redox enzyme family protein [Mycobacteriales bacterium]|nr:iron-containing redox enzyme family protein [Mycobacteriales bacterium]
MTPPVATAPGAARAASRETAAGPLASTAAPTGPTLADRLVDALADSTGAALDALAGAAPVDRRDRVLTLMTVHDLHTAPLDVVGAAVLHQHHPAVAGLKRRLEGSWLAELDAAWAAQDRYDDEWSDEPDPVARVVRDMRSLAATDRLPDAYRWLARTAGWDELVAFLALEGGPDGGFDDLVALCQVGLSGSAKLELGKNYWDEMGCGDLDAVHTTLHQRMAAAIGMPEVRREDQPVEALERIAVGGLLATNRWLQPEMVGALGLLELQAGPRCRLVVQAFDRLGAPEAAYPFYVEHADLDPVHGKDWLDKAVVPIVAEQPHWGPRIVKGAWIRSQLNLAFFDAARRELVRPASAA